MARCCGSSASGGVGREAVKALRASGWRVRAAVRTDAKRGDVPLVGADGDVEAVVVDVTKYETLPPALAGVDAIVVAVGTTDFTDPLGPYKNEYVGTKNVVAAARNAAAPGAGPKVVLVTSIGTEDPFFNPLNLAWGILFWKQRAEEELQRSGLRYTIVRPGGLSNDAVPGAAVLKPRGEARTGRVSRAEVARVCVEAIDLPEAEGKVVELVQDEGAAEAEMAVQFAAI
eukprot:PRCOL_00006217-RA